MQTDDWKNEGEGGEKAAWPRLLEQLRVPFMPEIVSWKPQTVSRDRRRCLAVPYVETQPYQERLDEICPDWQDDYAIWFSDPQETPGRLGEKRSVAGKVFVKCRLTIAEHTRADVGECELTDENAFTSAKAQAFKRACAAFGLGRYLYDLPKAWVDFDEDKGIPENELKKLEMALRRRAAAANGNAVSAPTNGNHANGHTAGGNQAAAPSNGGGQTPAHRPAAAPVSAGNPAGAAAATVAPVKEQAVAGEPASGSGQASAAKTRPVAWTSGPAAAGGRAAAGDNAAAPINGKARAAAAAANGGANGNGHTSAERPAAAQPVAGTTTPTAADPAQRSVAAAAAVLEAAGPAPRAADDQPLCPLHHVPLQLVITRDGKTHLLHKIEGEGYCNGEVVRATRQN